MRAQITILFWLFAFPLLAQEEALKAEADRLYADEQYNLAIQDYLQLVSLKHQNPEFNYQLAECYRKSFNYKEAEVYYLKTSFEAPETFPLSLYYHALMLKLNGSFAESIVRFDEFISGNSGKMERKEIVEQAAIDRAGSEMALAAVPALTHAIDETISSPYNDYAPALRDSATLVITSGRLLSNRSAVDERYGEGFTDNFYFTNGGTGWIDKTKQVFAITNTKYNDGSGCFSPSGDKYYFTVCGKNSPQCQIYFSMQKQNKWTEPVVLNGNVNLKNFESRHPAVSPGGDTLLFASNRPGGQGQYDIWMTIDAGDEDWGPPINLGPTVNTKLNELAPAFTPLANVFFLASDGHQNYGGLDLYMAKRFSNGNLALYNLDPPFNSNRDDCFMSFGKHTIYFSSNREGGKGGFDIYSVRISGILSFVSRLGMKNRGAREDVKLNARVEKRKGVNLIASRNEDRIEYENLTYDKKKIVDRMIAEQRQMTGIDQTGFAGLSSSDFEELRRIAVARAKELAIENASHLGRKWFSTPDINGQDIIVTGSVVDSLSGQPVPNQKILLVDENGEILTVTTTNDEGKFRFTNIPSGKKLFLRSAGENVTVVKDVLVTTTDKLNTVAFEDIFFDYDHYTLRAEALLVLDGLALYLKNHPSLQVDIHAYADDRGPIAYNFALTQKRGQAVLDYLSSRGVDQTSLAVVAKGKQRESSDQNELIRQFNRRVEFYINGRRAAVLPDVGTFILKVKTDWHDLSNVTGVSVGDLQKLNGSSRNELKPNEPIRIPSTAKSVPNALFYTIR